MCKRKVKLFFCREGRAVFPVSWPQSACSILHDTQGSKARISQLTRIVDVLTEDFVDYIGHCKDEVLIRRFSGKTLLRLSGLESPDRQQAVIDQLMEKIDI